MKYRQHKGNLSESLETTREIGATKKALALEASLDLGRVVTDREITVEPYCYDHRILWDTYIVTVEGHGVLGFTDGPVA